MFVFFFDYYVHILVEFVHVMDRGESVVHCTSMCCCSILELVLMQHPQTSSPFVQFVHYVSMLWFNFILGSNFIFLCFWVLVMYVNEFKSLNHNIYTVLRNQ